MRETRSSGLKRGGAPAPPTLPTEYPLTWLSLVMTGPYCDLACVEGMLSMAMGKRKQQQQEALFVTTDQLPRSAGHPVLSRTQPAACRRRLRSLGSSIAADRYYVQDESRAGPCIPPGVYFRMLLVGYFEGIDSQRGIAWRCATASRCGVSGHRCIGGRPITRH